MVMTLPLAAANPRSDEILESIRRIFAEKGFDGASMQDLARAAGMSVGNFYRYFPSKAAIVEAFVTRDLAEVEQEFAVIIGSPDPMAKLRDTLRARIEAHCCEGDGALWAEITAAAQRKPEVGAVAGQMEAGVMHYLITVFARVTGLSPDETKRRFGSHAKLIIMLVKATAMQRHTSGAEEEHLTRLIQRTIDGTLDEISNADVRG